MLKPPPNPNAPAQASPTLPPVEIKDKTVAELAKELAPEALLTLRDIYANPEAKPAARVAAANAIIERAEGKVGIQQEITVNYNTVINQINRALGKVQEVVDVTPERS